MNVSPHPIDELPGMLRGDLALDQIRGVTVHLRTCEECRRALVELTAGAAATARAARHGLVDSVPAPLPPLELPMDADADAVADADELRTARDARRTHAGSRRRTRWVALVAAAVVAIVATVAIVQLRDPSSTPDSAQVVLDAIGNPRAQGTVSMHPEGGNQVMVVSTNLPRAGRGHYYEVWLLDTETNGMVAVGVLPSSGRGEYTLPNALLHRYDAIDLSRQPDNGQTVHSSDSVLRAKYA